MSRFYVLFVLLLCGMCSLAEAGGVRQVTADYVCRDGNGYVYKTREVVFPPFYENWSFGLARIKVEAGWKVVAWDIVFSEEGPGYGIDPYELITIQRTQAKHCGSELPSPVIYLEWQ